MFGRLISFFNFCQDSAFGIIFIPSTCSMFNISFFTSAGFMPLFRYTEISKALPSSFENEDIDNAVLKHVANIIKIAAIVVIITILTQPVRLISLHVCIPNRYRILNSHNHPFGICFFTFVFRLLFISTCLCIFYFFSVI